MREILSVFLLLGLAANASATGNPIEYEVDGAPYQGYYTSPSGDAPLVLMIHDWDGLTDYEVKRAEMLKELGYSVFAADLFGKGVRPTAIEDKKELTGRLYGDRERMRNLLNGAVAAAKAQGGNIGNAITVGYCFGGAVTLEHARSGAPMKGFVSFHGGLTTPDGQDYSRTNGKLLILHGTADTAVSMQDFADLAIELEQAKVPHEMITYSGAPHAFTVFGSDRYRKDADEKSWRRFTKYLAEALE